MNKHSARPSARGLRPDIQALRALAVGLVVAFHLAPAALPGGYVGVDVFFVISGFLITGHLVREVGSTGGVRVGTFWAKRARRLLPAASVVLLASTIAVILVIPRYLWQQFLSQIIASALYLQNWLLARDSVDYMARANQPSIVQHFWSLSVEEQFYIVLPLIIVVVILIAKRTHLDSRRMIFVVLAVIAVASLVCSIVLTALDPASAYFVTTTRAWELAAGGLLSYARPLPLRTWRVPLTLVGLATIASSAVFFSGATAFPGIAAAAPVLATALIIAVNSGHPVTNALVTLRPVQYVGDISYTIYLWHWPLIVLAPFVVKDLPAAASIPALIVATLVLASLTTRFVERPLRLIRPQSRRVWPTFAVGATATALVLGVAGCASLVETQHAARTADAVTAAAQEDSDCYAAAAIANGCAEQPLVTDPAFAATDAHGIEKNDCTGGILNGPLGDKTECTYGDPAGSTTVVLVGDSHARQWMPALEAIAIDRHWRIITMVRSSCPFGDMPVADHGITDDACMEWRASALARIEELQPAAVFTSALTAYGYGIADYSMGTEDEQVAGFEHYLQKLTATGAAVFTMKDDPYFDMSVPACIAESGVDDCDRPRNEVLDDRPDALNVAAQRVDGVAVIDLTKYLCPERACLVAAGGVIIYQDSHHLTATYSRSLAPYMLDVIVASGALPLAG